MSIFAAFLLGMAGSLHCAAMCGPLVLALSAARPNKAWPLLYHSGRLVMYIALGALAGVAGSLLSWAGYQRSLSILAGATLLIVALSLLTGNGKGRVTLWLKGRFGSLTQKRSPAATMALGALNGLLPCGLVYLAVAAAAASGSVARGMATMLAFGAGTAPMMLGINLAGQKFSWTGPARWRRAALVCAALAGGLLILRGMALGIPYISPGAEPCCGLRYQTFTSVSLWP